MQFSVYCGIYTQNFSLIYMWRSNSCFWTIYLVWSMCFICFTFCFSNRCFKRNIWDNYQKKRSERDSRWSLVFLPTGSSLWCCLCSDSWVWDSRHTEGKAGYPLIASAASARWHFNTKNNKIRTEAPHCTMESLNGNSPLLMWIRQPWLSLSWWIDPYACCIWTFQIINLSKNTSTFLNWLIGWFDRHCSLWLMPVWHL